MSDQNQFTEQAGKEIKLFLCGDVMTGRGVDQVLPQSVDPQLHETGHKIQPGAGWLL